MTKKSTNRSKGVGSRPAIVLFGLDDANKPHAAHFDEAQVEMAVKAAGLMRLNVLKVATPEHAKIASSLPAGRIFANGRGFVPYVRKDLYAKVTEFAGAQATVQLRDSAAAAASPPRSESGIGSSDGSRPANPSGRRPGPALPRHWDEIDAGHLVLAQDADPKEGWWPAIVLEKNGDMFTLRWQAFPQQKKVLRHQFNVGLMYPGAAVEDHGSKAEPSSASGSAPSKSQYPRTWDEIGVDSLVLAKEDGPWGAWWEAIAIKQDGDAFTLRWRDYPQLPSMVRPRLNLALLYPNPH